VNDISAMSTPVELVVYLAADSPLVSMHARPLTFIEAKFMGKRPERRKEGGATFGTFRFLGGSKTGWLYMPHPGLLDDVARVQYFKELREAKPGLDQVASERLGLQKLVWEFAESRRLQDLNKEAVRLAELPQPTEPTEVQPPEVQPPVPLHPGDVYQGEWYQLAGEDDGEAVRIISARNADGSWQAYTKRHKITKVELDKLVHRISQTGQCICTYTKADDVCRCTAKFSINEADRALAVAEVERRHRVTKRLPPLREDDAVPDCILASEIQEQEDESRSQRQVRARYAAHVGASKRVTKRA